MDYSDLLYGLSVMLAPYLIASLVFMGIFKFGFKKKLNYKIAAIVGFIIGILVFVISVICAFIFTESESFQNLIASPEYLMASLLTSCVIGLITFVILYAVSKPLYKMIKK